jgi:hypothetical protein
LPLIFILSLALCGGLALKSRLSAAPAPANFLSAEKGYGVTIDLTQIDSADLPARLTEMQESGLTWLRQPVTWAELEPVPGQLNWTPLDRVFEAVAAANATQPERPFKIIAVLETAPQWARPAGTPPTTPPTDLHLFGDFARQVARRYGAQLDFYQIWHEPNLSANWGHSYVEAAAYANLLREAAINIREADPVVHILTAALAATTEPGPLNLNEIAYLDQLYQANAQEWFDIVAVQPLGLWTKPLEAPAPDQPNFRRTELLRQVMLNHNDAETPIWATAFGWVALPANWRGQPSPWSYDLPSVQTNRTAQAIDYARAHWPWLGPMLAVRWAAAALPTDDPARGFALAENPPLQRVFQQAAERGLTATVGQYPAPHRTGHYSPGWRFAAPRADIPAESPRTLTLFFEGTQLDVTVNRGQFRGYLWVTVDDQPANALPQDSAGRSYVVLYDPLRQTAPVTLARHLPAGRHTAVIEADGGWEQWAISGWAVSSPADSRAAQLGLAVFGLLALLSGGALAWRIGPNAAAIAQTLWAWSEIVIARYGLLGDRSHVAITFLLALSLYFAPGVLALVILPLLALAILLRPDVGLALVAFATFFYQTPVRLPVGAFSPVELALTLTVLGAVFRLAMVFARRRFDPANPGPMIAPRFTFFDLAPLALVGLALLSSLAAANPGVALREWRTVIVEAVIFYYLIRLNLNFAPHPHPQPLSQGERGVASPVGKLVDAFAAAAPLQATIALYLYFFTDRSIDAEGVHRALGLGYGSPNNLALMLGRAWPILLAVALLPGASTLRRGLYGLGLLLTSAALYLTYSKGALLLGLPAGLLAMAGLYSLHRWRDNWRRVVAALVAAGLLAALALIPFSQTERFRTAFTVEAGGTAFFRLKLWQAAVSMFGDYWPLGVGPDNFLYQYRTRYILPEAWQ